MRKKQIFLPFLSSIILVSSNAMKIASSQFFFSHKTRCTHVRLRLSDYCLFFVAAFLTLIALIHLSKAIFLATYIEFLRGVLHLK